MVKKKQGLQSSAAVPVPHDGPLVRVLRDGALQVREDDESLLYALHFCRASPEAAAADDNDDDDDTTTHTMTPLVKLLQTLTKVDTTIQQQLQALQQFRSVLVTQDRRDGDHDGRTTTRPVLLDHYEAGYRIWAELALGRQTPHTMKRAIVVNVLQTIRDLLLRPGDEGDVTSYGSSLLKVERDVVASLCRRPNDWHDALTSLHDAFTGVLTLAINDRMSRDKVLAMLEQEHLLPLLEVVSTTPSGDLESETHDWLARVVMLLKVLLEAPGNSSDNMLELPTIMSFLETILRHVPYLPTDTMASAGIAYGRAKVLLECHSLDVDTVLATDVASMPTLHQLVAVQGVTSAWSDEGLVRADTAARPVLVLFAFFAQKSRSSANPEERLTAWKGIRTLLSRCGKLAKVQSSDTIALDETTKGALRQLALDATDNIMAAWDRPPSKQIAAILSHCFVASVQLLQDVQINGTTTMLQVVLDQVWSQPVHRQGRYLALETLLPLTGASALLERQPQLIADLLQDIGNPASHVAGAAADLWARLLAKLRHEKQQQCVSCDSDPETKQHDQPNSTGDINLDGSYCANDWLSCWVPTLAQALIDVRVRRRTQVASLCLPRILVLVVGPQNRRHAAACTVALLHELGVPAVITGRTKMPLSKERECATDRVAWACLRIIYWAGNAGLITSKSEAVRDAVTKSMPLQDLESLLVHFLSRIRMAAFQALVYVVQCHLSAASSDWEKVRFELRLWEQHFPYSVRTQKRETTAVLLQTLLLTLSRASASCSIAGCAEEVSVVKKFAVSFLIKHLVVRRCMYPGSNVDAQNFGMQLLDCVLAFACPDFNTGIDSNLLPSAGTGYFRARQQAEVEVTHSIRLAALDGDTIQTLLGILHSPWNASRNGAFKLLSKLIMVSRHYNIPLPREVSARQFQNGMAARAFYLASSPRQREADTGSKMLASQFLTCSPLEKKSYLSSLLSKLDDLIARFANALKSAVGSKDDSMSNAVALPLPHGLICGIRHILQLSSFHVETDWTTLTSLLCRALQSSIAVVADVAETDDSAFEMLGDAANNIIINPGAIGANGIVSSVKFSSTNGQSRVSASQRVVVGCWLLMRESCAALAAAVKAILPHPEPLLVEEVGRLLLQALTSIKHAGAAFAAHDSLQDIAHVCVTCPALKHMLPTWASWLQAELAVSDKVNDSTLRRSTGYGLGFLAIMRAECTLGRSSREMCPMVIRFLLKLAIPSTLNLDNQVRQVWTAAQAAIDPSLTDEGVRSTKSRVHALNVLRAIILDAALVGEARPFIGDAIVAAVLGYVDRQWAIRNSSTMLFASIVSQTIDSDRNATHSTTVATKVATLNELHRAYPSLLPFLASILEICFDCGTQAVDCVPPIFPILVLLSRVQPVSSSGVDGISRYSTLADHVNAALGQKSISVRAVASKAAVNLCLESNGTALSPSTIVEELTRHLTSKRPIPAALLNRLHGLLLTTKIGLEHPIVYGVWQNAATHFNLAEGIDILLRSVRPVAPSLCLGPALKIHQSITTQASDSLSLARSLMCRYGSARGANSMFLSTLGNVAGTLLITANQSRTDSQAGADSSVLHHSNFDLRVASVKAFKKRIDTAVDELITIQGTDCDDVPRADRFHDMLVAAVNNLVTGEGSAFHDPTLRRLTRCMIEISSVRESQGISELNYSTGLRIMNICGFHSCSEERVSTALQANACELVAMGIVGCTDDYTALQQLNIWIEELAGLQNSWRVRHSAAVAVGSCKARTTATLTNVLIKLLEDPDEDVRLAASRAVDADTSGVAEIALQSVICSHTLSTEQLVHQINSTVLDASKAVAEITVEMDITKDAQTTDIANTFQNRKIFEDEDANPYAEPNLVPQFIVAAALEGTCNGNDDDSAGCIGGYQACSLLVTEILQHGSHDIFHDLTWCRQVFVPLYTALLACATLAVVRPTTQTSAQYKRLIQLALQFALIPSLHPLIRRVLRALPTTANADMDWETSKHNILDCCFLIRPASAEMNRSATTGTE